MLTRYLNHRLIVRFFLTLLTIVYLSRAGMLSANVRSGNSNLHFDINNGGVHEMTINTTGLGIGTIPSTNLQVVGNAIITGSLSLGSTSSSSNLHINGSWALKPRTISSNVEVGQSSSLVLADSSSNCLSLTLPYAANVTGRMITIKKTSPLNTVYVSGHDLIDHYYQIEINAATYSYPSIKLMSSDNQWYIMEASNTIIGKDPSSHSNLMVWYDAADTSSLTLDASGNVTTWKDKSGYSRNVDQSTADHRPKYVTKAYRDHGALRFDGVDDYLGSTYTVGENTNLSVFMITKYNNSISYAGSTYRVLLSLGPPTDSDVGIFSLYHTTSSINNLTAKSHSTMKRNVSTTFNVDTSYSLSTAMISGLSDGDPSTATMAGFLNGVSVGTDSEVSLNSGNVLPLWIGGCSSASTRRFDGDICEVIVYNRDLTSVERQDVEAYLELKWRN